MADSFSFIGQTISHYRIVEKLGCGHGCGVQGRRHALATRTLHGLRAIYYADYKMALAPSRPLCGVGQRVSKTAFSFIQSAMTRFTARIFLYRSRVSPKEAFERLEPDEYESLASGS